MTSNLLLSLTLLSAKYQLSALSNFIGYTLLYLGVSYRISHGAVVMGLYMFMAGIGNVAGYQAGLVTNVKNFPAAHRGKVRELLHIATERECSTSNPHF